MARLGWVSLSPVLAPPGPVEGVQLDTFPTLEALLELPQICDVVVLDGPPEAMGAAARRLRADQRYQLGLIYTSRAGDPWCAALSDGELPGDGAAITTAWRQWQERQPLFNRGQAPEGVDQSLLCWLWQRPSAAIQPVRDPSHAHIYRYPLVEAITADERLSSDGWLRQKQQENVLDAGDLIDRIRQCPACSSSRLNYVDVCPECHGLDIVRQPSLHCFVCGHVAPQQNFLKGDALVCPNCLSQLRHIGSDYDRPLENYRCRGCGAFFVDAEVDVHCLDCCEVSQPDDLRVREIRSFRLSETGALACRHGLGDNGAIGSYFHRLKVMDRGEFLEALNWQMAIARRYGRSSGSAIAALLGVRIENIEQLFAHVGEARATAMLEGLLERLQQIIRDTDRCMRGREDTLWLLLPHTSAPGLDRVRERLHEGLERIQSGAGGAELSLKFVGCVLPEQIQDEEDAALMLARLAGDLR